MAESGIKAVFLTRRPSLRRLLLARLGDASEADDVLQEVWLRIEQARTGPVQDPAAYITRMALNLATDRRIADRRREGRNSAWSALQPDSGEMPGQEELLMARSELDRVQALLDSMPEAMRRALLLFRLEGRSQKQIAEELGMSLSGVEKLLARGYRQLVEFQRAALAEPMQRLGSRGEGSKADAG